MINVFVRCYAELNYFLPAESQFNTFTTTIEDNSTLEQLLSKIGVPSNNIDLVLVNGSSVDLSTKLKDMDRIALFPVFESFDISSILKIRDKPLRKPKFILDVHLGKLARLLRLFGFDTLYKNSYEPDILISISLNEERTLLSKSQKLIETKSLTRAYRVKNFLPYEQLIEIFNRFDLYNSAKPFSRCIECNTELYYIEKEKILNRIPEKVRDWCNEFQKCDFCDRIYWKGSHYDYMSAYVNKVIYEKHK